MTYRVLASDALNKMVPKVRSGRVGYIGFRYGTSMYTLKVASSEAKNPRNYDYVCDGTADDVEIQAAYDALPSRGGKVELSEGRFWVTKTLIPPDNSTTQGAGEGTQLWLAADITPMFKGPGATPRLNGVVLRDFHANGDQANRSTGTFVQSGHYNCRYEGLHIASWENVGIQFDVPTDQLVVVSNCWFSDNTDKQIVLNNGITGVRILGCRFENPDTIAIEATNPMQLEIGGSCEFQGPKGTDFIYINGQNTRGVTIAGNVFEIDVPDPVVFQAAISLIHTPASDQEDFGQIAIVANTFTYSTNTLNIPRFIRLVGTDSAPNVSRINRVAIVGNSFGRKNGGSGTCDYILRLVNVDDVAVLGNVVENGMIGTSFLDISGTNNRLRIHDNPGVADQTENGGAAASVADGGTISHGLYTTPTFVTVTPTVAGEFASVTAKGASTFTVALKKHDGSAGTAQTVYWRAWV